jgi:hypothetical protein
MMIGPTTITPIITGTGASRADQRSESGGLVRARETDLLKPFASDVSIDQPNDVGNANAKPSLRPTLAAFAPPTLAVAATRNEGANTMIMERGARPDALPKPKRARTVLAGVLGVGVGLVLGLGVGLGVLGWAWLRH